MTTLLTYNWFWLLLFGGFGLAALLLLLLIVYQLARIAGAVNGLCRWIQRERIERIERIRDPVDDVYDERVK